MAAVAVRCVDGKTCCLKSCLKDIKASEDAVIVATNEKLRAQIQGNVTNKFLANWNKGTGAFHKTCWSTLSASTRPSTTLSKEEALLLNDAKQTAEYYDNQDILFQKVQQAANLIKESKYLVAFTGAGVSVSAGIADYRGTTGIDTQYQLGQRENQEGDVEYEKLLPTLTHKALVTLEKLDLLKYIISQNCDNLHLKAGTSRDKISELHGNVFIEHCEVCQKEYQREYCVDLWSTNCYKEPWYIKCKDCTLNHYTGRLCDEKVLVHNPNKKRGKHISQKCGGKLRDTIVNFGDKLHPSSICGGLSRARKESKKAEVMVCLGSSLSVTPASTLPRNARKIVICNLQDTECDDISHVRVYAPCDTFMKLLLEALKVNLEGDLNTGPPSNTSHKKRIPPKKKRKLNGTN